MDSFLLPGVFGGWGKGEKQRAEVFLCLLDVCFKSNVVLVI